MIARLVAMLTRLIDRFETDDTRNRGFPSSASPIVLVLVVVLVLDLFAGEQMHPGAKPENKLRDVPPRIAREAPSTFLISFVLEKGRPSVNEKHGSRYRVGGVGA